MRLFVVGSDPAFPLLQPAREGPWCWRGGVAAERDWDIQDLELAEGGEPDFIEVDCFGLNTGSDGFVVSEHAMGAVERSLAPLGEFLPVRVLGHRYFWFNCLARVDALDRGTTEAEWGLVEGAWGSFRWITTTRRLSFVPERVADAPMLFRIPEYPQGVLFAGRELVDLVEGSNLTGFRFDAVWSSEEGGVEDPPGLGFRGVFERVDDRDRQRRREQAREQLRRRGGSLGGRRTS